MPILLTISSRASLCIGGSVLIVVMLALAGCRGCGESSAAGATASASGSASAAIATGLAAPSNHPDVVSAAKAVVEKCKFNQAGGYFVPSCAEVQAFIAARLLESDEAQRSVVAMLSDADARVRGLGARALGAHGTTYRSDAVAAERVIAALNAESHRGVALQLADAVARIDADESGTTAALKKLASSHASDAVRARLVGPLLRNNLESLYDFTKELAVSDPSEAVRVSAVGAFWSGLPQAKMADACAFWARRVREDENQRVAGKCAYFIAFKRIGGDCVDHHEELLADIHGLAAKGQVSDQGFASALKYLHGNDQASDAHRAKAVVVAKAILANGANHGIARAEALRFIAGDTAGGKALVRRYLQDDSVHVRGAAERASK